MTHIHKKVKISDKSWKPVGVVTFTSRKLMSARAREIDRILGSAVLMPKRQYKGLMAELDALCPTKQVVKCNLVVQAGRNVLAGILNGETTYTGIINYGILGSGSTAVSSSDTQLATEVKRKQVATRSRSGSQVNFDFYYSKSDTNGTYNEFGMVIDGTASANTGQLFNRLLTGGWTKSSSESLTASVQIDLNAS